MNLRNRVIKFYLQKVKGVSLPRDLIKYAVKRNCNKIAVIDGERKITYGELYERAKKLANGLLGLGLNKGDKLAVLLYNSQEYFEIRIAAYLTGMVLVPIVWDMELEDIIFILNDCEVKALIYHPEILGDNTERLKKETRVGTFIEIASEKEGQSPSGTVPLSPRNDNLTLSLRGREAAEAISYENLVSQGASAEPDIELKETDLASINFSSGTTGRPKGIMLLQKSWMASFYNYILNAKVKRVRERIPLYTLSLATAGSTMFLVGFIIGAKDIILKRFSVEEAVNLILRYDVNGIFISPSYFIPILDYCRDKKIKLPLNYIAIGTEQMPEAKFKEALEYFGPIIYRGYGMAECLPPVAIMNRKDYMEHGRIKENRLLSVGRAVKGVEIRIVDDAGKDIAGGSAGRIALKSGSNSIGYWNNPQLTNRHYKNGGFYSNDFGYMDSEGYLYILGREEDIIKKKDEEIVFAGQIEEALHKNPNILEACVFMKEKEIIACVSLRAGARDTSSEGLSRFCQDKLEKDIVPGIIKIFPELPKNASGKLDRKKMKNIYFGKSK